MFTGLIQGIGKVQGVEAKGPETRFRVRADFPLPDLAIGESIAINGACLTVETHKRDFFTVYASAETLSKTNLGRLKTGSTVNLERALALGDRLGGHMVSGHVDCLAVVASVAPAGESRLYRLEFPPEFGALVVPKGSVALDGISLTVNECGPEYLTVNIIPETWKKTAIASWQPGYEANMETDLIGKYVRRMLAPWLEAGGSGKGSSMSEEFLSEHGFK